MPLYWLFLFLMILRDAEKKSHLDKDVKIETIGTYPGSLSFCAGDVGTEIKGSIGELD